MPKHFQPSLDALFRLTLASILIFNVFNYVFSWLPFPEMPIQAGKFIQAIVSVGYLFPLIKTIEAVVAVFLLINRYMVLAMVLWLPILTNYMLFHWFLAPQWQSVSVFLSVVSMGIIAIRKQDFIVAFKR